LIYKSLLYLVGSSVLLYLIDERSNKSQGTGNVDITLDQGTFVLLYSLVCSPVNYPVWWRSR